MRAALAAPSSCLAALARASCRSAEGGGRYRAGGGAGRRGAGRAGGAAGRPRRRSASLPAAPQPGARAGRRRRLVFWVGEGLTPWLGPVIASTAPAADQVVDCRRAGDVARPFLFGGDADEGERFRPASLARSRPTIWRCVWPWSTRCPGSIRRTPQTIAARRRSGAAAVAAAAARAEGAARPACRGAAGGVPRRLCALRRRLRGERGGRGRRWRGRRSRRRRACRSAGEDRRWRRRLHPHRAAAFAEARRKPRRRYRRAGTFFRPVAAEGLLATGWWQWPRR